MASYFKETIQKDLTSKIWSGNVQFPLSFCGKSEVNFQHFKYENTEQFFIYFEKTGLKRALCTFNLLFDCELYRDLSLLSTKKLYFPQYCILSV
jgi:hypothetical protein